jgi:hypothetical protein
VERKYGNLEIEEDLAFQQRTWKVERAGWVLMALIALASIVGLIDEGPLSRTSKGDAGSLQVRYERFLHLDSPTQVRVILPVNGPFSLQLPVRYLENMEISHIVPEPVNVASSSDQVIYSFAARRGTADVLFNLKTRKAGSMKGFIQAAGRRVDFAHFVYP